MKNQMLFVTLMAILTIFATSCSKPNPVGPGVDVQYSLDTTISHNEAVTDSIGLCAGGKSKYLKIVGEKVVVDSISMSGKVHLNDENLNGIGYHYDGKPVASINETPANPGKVKSYNNGFMNMWIDFWNFFGPFLGLILAAVIAGLILYLLYSFFRWLSNQMRPERREERQTQHVTQTVIREPREDRVFVIGGQGLPAGTMVGASNASNFFGGTHNHNHFYGNNVTVSNDRVNQNPPQS